MLFYGAPYIEFSEIHTNNFARCLHDIIQWLDESVQTPLPLCVGKRIGHLDLIERLGKGPNGPTWLAIDTRLDRMVTLKLLPSIDPVVRAGQGAELLNLVERFAMVSQKNAVVPKSASGANVLPAWILRDYIGGLDLKTLCKRGDSIGVLLSIAVLHEVAGALAAFHRIGITHCNLKSTNVLLTEDGDVYVVDPGISQELVRRYPAAGAPTPVDLGEHAYLAPEQHRGNSISPATDIFQFGILAYWLFSGNFPPYLDEYTPSVALPDEVYKRLESHAAPIQRLITSCLASNPTDRSISMDDVQRICTEQLTEHGVTAEEALCEGMQPYGYAFLLAKSGKRSTETRDIAQTATMPLGKTLKVSNVDPSAHPKLAAAPSRRETESSSYRPIATEDIVVGPAYDIQKDDVAGQIPNRGPKLAAAPANRDKGSPLDEAETLGDREAAPTRIFSMSPDVLLDIPTTPSASPVAGGITVSVRSLIIIAVILGIGVLTWWNMSGDSPVPTTYGPSAEQPSAPSLTPEQLVKQAQSLLETAPEEALAAATSAAKLRPNDPDIELLRSRILKRLDRTSEAADALARAVRLRPADIAPQQELVGVLLRSGSPKQALKAAAAALEVHSTDATLYVLRARAELADANYLAAAASLANATRLSPDRSDAWLLLGNVRSRQERWTAAAEAFERAVELSPTDTAAYAGLAHTIRRSRRSSKKTVDLLLSRTRTLPANQNFLMNVARILLAETRVADAQSLLQPYTARYPEDAMGFFQLGLSRMLGGENGAAGSAFEKALEIQPGDASAWYNLGLVRARAGDYLEALEAFDHAVQHAPDLTDAACERARVLQRLGRTTDAVTGYKSAARDSRLAVAQILGNSDLKTVRSALMNEMPCGAPFLDAQESVSPSQ